MERMSIKKLPPIFKMSVLCNILPYYGHLHRWRRLLEKIKTETKEIWDQNREQLMYIGRNFKRDIELDKLNEYACNLSPHRSWIDLFSLSLSYYFDINKFNFTNLTCYITEDEVIIIDSHDDIFKAYQIHFCTKVKISDILPAIKCPSFKSETKIFKTSEMEKMCQFIEDLNHTKSIVIENVNEKLSINLVYGNTLKCGPWTLWFEERNEFLNKLKERCKLCEIGDCACKPKKIRVLADDFEDLKIASDQLKWISNINDAKIGMRIGYDIYDRSFSIYDKMFFNHSACCKSDEGSNFVFSGDTLTAVYEGNYFNFRLDERTKKFEDSAIKGNIIKNFNQDYFALDVDVIDNLRLIHSDEEEIKRI